MNKLEEYKIDKGDKYRQVWEDGGAKPEIHQGFEDGFSAALSLDLPVKFAKWTHDNLELAFLKGNTFLFKTKPFTTEELYQYWIDNIYKPE